MTRIIDIEALNLRSAPQIAEGNRIAILHLGQEVEELAPVSASGWVNVRTSGNGGAKTGYVKAEIDELPTLRSPAADNREALVSEAIGQWLRFEKGQGLEHQAPFFKYVGQMWKAIGLDLDGKDRDQPWSAAAISFMVRAAAEKVKKYGRFKFAPAHSRYMHDAIVKRTGEDARAPFWGYRLHEQRPQLGDLVCRWRETPRDFDDAASSDAFKSHSDIIVSVRPDHVLAIGGNVSHSVSITRYAKTGAGYLAAQDEVFMLMVNRA